VLLQTQSFDVVLLDIHMPGMDGVHLAQLLRDQTPPPAVVFVTAHAGYALQAFEVEAVDYLTKPVRLERLQQALQKVERNAHTNIALEPDLTIDFLLIHDRGRAERVPLPSVLYLKAELKYITVRTATKNYILDGALGELEQRYPSVAGFAGAGKTLRSRRGRGLGGAPARLERAADGVAAAIGGRAGGDCSVICQIKHFVLLCVIQHILNKCLIWHMLRNGLCNPNPFTAIDPPAGASPRQRV
jgi:DNA-binding NarL/FixJ family response regulator